MLEAADLECARGGRVLFRGLSLALKGGDLVRVAGENGRGKTSLLRILCGLLTPDAGTVKWNGEPIVRIREEFSRHVVYLGHAPAVKDDLTAAENLFVTARIAGLAAEARAVEKALESLSVPDRPVGRLSQGQRRRAALARLALSESVPVWLLDEPLAALDAHAAELVELLVTQHVGRGGSVVVTTHQSVNLSFSRTVDLDA